MTQHDRDEGRERPAERWVKWAAGLALGIVVIALTAAVQMRVELSTLQMRFQVKYEEQEPQRIQVQKDIAAALSKLADQHQTFLDQSHEMVLMIRELNREHDVRGAGRVPVFGRQ